MVEVDPFRDDSFFHVEDVKFSSQCRRFIRQIDLYALPVTMRYKNEKMFYTNFGAFSSILLILGMVGLFISYLFTMLARTDITSSITTVLSENKDSKLTERGGLFLFGYRLYN